MNDASKTPTPEIRKCFVQNGGNCANAMTYAAKVVSLNALPPFVVQTGTTAALVMTPTTAAHMGTWTIQATQTATYSSFGTKAVKTFDAMTITVSCTITSVPNPTPPNSGLTYNLYDTMLTIDLSSIKFTQSPPCEYPATSAITWTIPQTHTNVITVSQDKLKLYVYTLDKSKLGTHDVTLANVLTYNNANFNSGYTFKIVIADPCTGTSLKTQAITTLTTLNGTPGTVDFVEVRDSQGFDRGQNALCGPRNYAIKTKADAAIPWVTVAKKAGTAETYTISANPTEDAHATTHNLKLIVGLDLYQSIAKLEIDFNVVVSSPPCDCTRVKWDPPSA